MKMEIMKKEAEENQKWIQERDNIIIKKLQAVIIKQNNELQALRTAFEKERSELETLKDKEIETLEKKFKNMQFNLKNENTIIAKKLECHNSNNNYL